MENNERLITACILDENDNITAKCCFFNTTEELTKEINDYVVNELNLQNVEIYIDNDEIFSEDELKTLVEKGYHFE
ncbi:MULTISPECIES: hypothetical protein [Chryseobacterium]|uniref:hypothetical protein n=1 Tax=Chryseobacterium TaxID=59732 RepID=UPI00063D142D|nr:MULTISPECIES: hypothetical protein [Chryseobacterium]MDM1555976.1 hypothetical protein [Chryseobacterium indologenes]MEB4761349.1 hypothetical protein [Chryseobacterium indologenes]